MRIGGGYHMDKERVRDLKRSGSRSSPAKRQQRALSGHIIPSNNHNKPLSFPSSPSGSNSNCDASGGGGEVDAMEKWKKERVKGMRWSSSNNEEDGGGSEGEEANIFRPPITTTTTSLSSRKRVKLRGKKVSRDYNVVDPALVPRRLRSAINKCSSQSASPPLPDSNRKQLHDPNGTQESNAYGAGRFKQNMQHDPITNEEKEVAETLTAMASLIPVCKPVKTKEDRRMFEDNSETKATSTSLSEASKEEGAKFLLPCVGTEATNPSSCVEETREETMKAEPSAREQPAAASVSQKFDAESIGTSQPDFQRMLLSNRNEQAENSTSSRDALNSSNPLGTSLKFFPENGGISQPTQFDALSVHKTDIGLCPFGSASVECKMRSVNQKPDSGPHFMCREETTVVRPGLPSSIDGHLTRSSSNKAAACSDSAAALATPTRNDLLTAKLPPVTTARKQPWKRCATHVYISHLIQNYRSTERKQRPALQTNQSKAKKGTNSNVHSSNVTVSGSRNGILPSLPIGSLMEGNMHEARARMLQDGKFLQAQQAYAQHSQVPHHSVMPFPFPCGPYTSYPDQLAAAATQQVQMQLPPYIGSSPFYGGPHMGAAATKQQQQQMWQFHMARYRPLLGFPEWQQNGRHHHHHDNSSSLSVLTYSQSPPSIFPSLPSTSEMPQDGGAYHPPNNPQQQQQKQQHLLVPIPSSSSSSSRAKQKQKQHSNGGVVFMPELQLICDAQHM